MKGWFAPGTRRRRVAIGAVIYVLCTTVFFATAAKDRIVSHTPYNHYALLADSWLHGRLDMRGPPPPYAGGNDFAQYKDKWYVSFPPFPAVWLLPWVKLGGVVENVRDGQAFMWLAGVGPAVLWLVLEKLRRSAKSERSERVNVALALLFGLGTVYWFTAVQGTVWFAAHVVAVALSALYLLFAMDAERPVLAGLMLGFCWMTRPTTLFMGFIFALEALRISLQGGLPSAEDGSLAHRIRLGLARLEWAKLMKRWGLFLLPLMCLFGISLAHNYARFGRPLEFGHEYLTVAWRGRIEQWGLFSYHYLARNLGVMLTSLPYLTHVPSRVQINGHGLALWVTSPFYLWLLWPKKPGWQYFVFAASALAIAGTNLLYQNSGWMQFGFRFSNDFAILLFVLLALGARRFGVAFWIAAAIAVIVNGFGAMTFDRQGYSKFYFIDGSQRVLYQPD